MEVVAQGSGVGGWGRALALAVEGDDLLVVLAPVARRAPDARANLA